ncbi:hypothetical protein ITP53_14330 [Nonomuraea sp. K274]|uniref:Uncharacterized protein n=1 Tax=Nonomuraea cypriaca TaxID=1187855 RepID=A0A931ABF3_9ACTN|nr:hypothetical protein [Nonomuraea cypriaca]MBF8186895.1 hypothetical protein [Nonomuraea cypriaca]
MADVGDQRPSYDSPTTPFRKIVLPAEETVQIPRPPGQVPLQRPIVPPEPPSRGIGDIPIRALYLLGAILATVAAVALVFVLFSGDVPTSQEPGEEVVRVAPVPTSATPEPSATPTVTESPIVLPPVPESKAYANLPGKASAVINTISDKESGISYPRLASPWKARDFPPYAIAQRIGKLDIPQTVVGSAMFPGDSPAKKPSSNADYREIATDAARWAIRTQYPKGATLEWTASKKVSLGKGWTLGYKVTFTSGGKEQVAQAMVSVIEVGKTKPAMLIASIPEANKARWRDLNTLAAQVRPL